MSTTNGKSFSKGNSPEVRSESGFPSGALSARAQGATPYTDIFEREDSVTLVVDLPGVEDSGLNINIEKNVLSIEGKISERKFEGYKLRHRELPSASYARSFTLSDVFDIDSVKAELKDGVLRLDLPKSEKVKPKKIEVRVG